MQAVGLAVRPATAWYSIARSGDPRTRLSVSKTANTEADSGRCMISLAESVSDLTLNSITTLVKVWMSLASGMETQMH